jgi:hypothetical protein
MFCNVKRFAGEDNEDVDEFLKSVLWSFSPYESCFAEPEKKERAKVLVMASFLDGKAKKW